MTLMHHEETEQKLHDLVRETRAVLIRAMERERFRYEQKEFFSLRKTFEGYCGLAQCVAGYALQDAGAVVRPLATQSLEVYRAGHAALTVSVNDDSCSRLYLIDPTFVQFCRGRNNENAPGNILDRTEAGREIKKELLEKGFIELTPERAQLYLASFCAGRAPFQSTQNAFEFCTNPPAHGYHYKHDYNDDMFSRENLLRNGDAIRGFKF